jgi:hypothetical protein
MMIGRSLQDYEEQKLLTGILSPNSSVKKKNKKKTELQRIGPGKKKLESP